jgi:hypothetical protein
MTGATLVRATSPATADAATYVAVLSADAVTVLADLMKAGLDGQTLPWSVLPAGMAAGAASQLRVQRRPYADYPLVLIGTTVAGEWTTWHPPGPPPALPLGQAADDDDREMTTT